MRIHGLTVVKNERDVIVECLEAAMAWCDYIYVLDNGSTDGTWDAVLELSEQYEGVVPYKRDDRVFQTSFRAEIFNYYRERASRNDWWCTLDADEFYIDNPREFLARVPEKYQLVWSAGLTYYFTDKDYERYQQDPSFYDDNRPVEEKCRYYLSNWSERRFFRYYDDVVWEENATWPVNLGLSYPRRLRMKHYQWRSPRQMQKRLDVRMEAIGKGCRTFRHEWTESWQTEVYEKFRNRRARRNGRRKQVPGEDVRRHSWEERIVDSSKLDYDAHDGRYVFREELMPGIKGTGSKPVKKTLKRARRFLWRNLLGGDAIGVEK